MENILSSQKNSSVVSVKSSVYGSPENAAIDERSKILKYLFEIATRLIQVKNGMENNIGHWQGLPENPEVISEHIRETLSLGMEIEKLKQELSLKYMKARELKKNKKVLIDTLEKRAVGIHAHQQEALTDYGIKFKSNTTNNN